MATDMEQVVTIEMKHDPETLKIELEEDKASPTFEDQTLEANDTIITGEEPAMHQFI